MGLNRAASENSLIGNRSRVLMDQQAYLILYTDVGNKDKS